MSTANDNIYRCFFFSAMSHEPLKVITIQSVKSKTEFLESIARFIETYEQSDVACELSLTFSVYNHELDQDISHKFQFKSITLKDAIPLFKSAKAAIEACPYG